MDRSSHSPSLHCLCHLVLKVDIKETEKWSQDEVIQRWLCLNKGPFLIHKYLKGDPLCPAEQQVLENITETWRQRLYSVSEFMQRLNQSIARQANQEENCTGRFWEDRFKSHPLLTEEALLTAMAYVDLNPVRAKMADTPEQSGHTSVKERIHPEFDPEPALVNNPDIDGHHLQRFSIKPLAQFEGNIKAEIQNGVLFSFTDYLTLVDATGRIQRDDKRGAISDHLLPILERLGIDANDWLVNTKKFETVFYRKLYYRRAEHAA